MSIIARAAELLRAGALELLDMLAPSLERELAQVRTTSELVRSELGLAVASAHLARKRGDSARELEDALALQRELERLLASLAVAEAELTRELAQNADLGDSARASARDPLDSPARDKRIRRRLRELQAQRRR
ncbi:MAG: hypothetical protein ABW352_12865 [Polyangiales bacterium]